MSLLETMETDLLLKDGKYFNLLFILNLFFEPIDIGIHKMTN